jgi:hypothetical protein
MEIRINRHILKKRLQLAVLVLLLLTGAQIQAWSQKTVSRYTIKDGKMLIILGKNIKAKALDSFIVQFNLGDLDLPHALKSNSFYSLQKQGWEIKTNNGELFIISKKIKALRNYNSPADHILIAEKHPTIAERFPSVSEKVLYGMNKFRNKSSFAAKDSMVTFYLRDHVQVPNVFLAGSFNNWEPRALSMKLTDSGWIALVKLTPGKYWYKFIIDGNWEIDRDNSLREEDGYGNTNSVFFKTNTVFQLPGFPNAGKVWLEGSFNDWRSDELEMNKVPGGWESALYLAPGTHTYKFLVDGAYVVDPKNPNHLPDGHHGFNSVIQIGIAQAFILKGFTAAGRVILTGSFNHWRTDELEMNKTTSGWKLSYTVGPGNYEYNFIVDGKWITDPDNPQRIMERDILHSYLIVAPNYEFMLSDYLDAKKVFVAGDFNNWNPSLFQMVKRADQWFFPLHLSIGRHEYKFIVDGQWIKDPGNKLWEQNEKGSNNSVIWIDH